MSSTSSTRSPSRGVVIVMCSAMTSSPRIVPPSAVYECVDRIASGSSKMRDSTSPTRRPPRAMQMIWLKSPAGLVDLQREPLDQRVVLRPS